MLRTIAVIIYPGFYLLDATAPMTAFEIVERFCPGSYKVALLAPGGGEVESTSGVKVVAGKLSDDSYDTVIVSGGVFVHTGYAFEEIVSWLRRVKARRTASVCAGAYLLAMAGRLDGRRATTHWESRDDFRHRYPKVKLDADRVFVRDGDIWTSAGISAGIDLALALIEDDLGPDIARRIAQHPVIYQRRPSAPSQLSALIELTGPTGRFVGLLEWMSAHLAEPLTVERLAHQTAMSPRNFARAFKAETGTTPAKAVERLRLETARTALETSHTPLEQIAERVGFGDHERMRRAFLRNLGQSPQALRRTARS